MLVFYFFSLFVYVDGMTLFLHQSKTKICNIII